MKVYSISSPEKLSAAADIIKWPSEKRKVSEFIANWDGPQDVTLELGRNARIYYIGPDGRKAQLASLLVIPARHYAEEVLTET